MEQVMKAAIPLYEGDSLIHFNAASGSSAVQGRSEWDGPWTPILQACVRFFRWLERGAERVRYRELENYLAASTDLCDLERRIREVERKSAGAFDPYS